MEKCILICTKSWLWEQDLQPNRISELRGVVCVCVCFSVSSVSKIPSAAGAVGDIITLHSIRAQSVVMLSPTAFILVLCQCHPVFG